MPQPPPISRILFPVGPLVNGAFNWSDRSGIPRLPTRDPDGAVSLDHVDGLERLVCDAIASDILSWIAITIVESAKSAATGAGAIIFDLVERGLDSGLDAIVALDDNLNLTVAFKAALWRKVEGADNEYKTGFFLLADLAFKIGQLGGLKVCSRLVARKIAARAEDLRVDLAFDPDYCRYRRKWGGPPGGETCGVPWVFDTVKSAFFVSTLACFNEIGLLPLQIKYLRSQGITPFVIDNMSDDNSWEWIVQNRIPGIRFDTGSEYQLGHIQEERLRIQRAISPRWVLYGDVDEFVFAYGGLSRLISTAEEATANAIRIRRFTFHRTDESGTSLPQEYLSTYFYGRENYKQHFGIVRIHQHSEAAKYHGDSVSFPNLRLYQATSAVNLNFAEVKEAKLRYAVLLRCRAAWNAGLPSGFCAHFESGLERSWRWTKKELSDIRTTEFWPLIKSEACRYFGNAERV